jgi:hypothetical protein
MKFAVDSSRSRAIGLTEFAQSHTKTRKSATLETPVNHGP